MTFKLDSGSTSRNSGKYINKEDEIKRVVLILNKILNALGEFKGKYDKKFNFSRLANYLKISSENVHELISVILNFQEKFQTIFNGYQLTKKILNNQIYITLENKNGKKTDIKSNELFQKENILITKSHLNHLSDIIYTFQYLNKGKGFDCKTNKTEFIERLMILLQLHPYFFLKKDNNLIYPSELGIELGNLVRSYDKSNKTIENIEIKKYKFIIDKNDISF